MKSSCIACAGVMLLFTSAAYAAPPPPSPLNHDCANGFAKSEATSGGDTIRWVCATATVVCPPRPAGYSGGLLGPKAETVGAGAKFSYACVYRKLPK
jgi:hypothetical protein